MSGLSLKTIPIGLTSLDTLDADVLVLSPFGDERPLRGSAGFCDWRLNGRLSRLVQAGWFKSQPREVLLMDTCRRIGTRWILLFGQGLRNGMTLDLFQQNLQRTANTLKKARFLNFAIELPGVDPGPLSVPQAVSAFLDIFATDLKQAKVTLLSPYQRFIEMVDEIAGEDERISIIK